MFMVQIQFADDMSHTENILIRRPQFIVGSSDAAHVVVDDLKSEPYHCRFTRNLGDEFICELIPLREGISLPEGIEGKYNSRHAFVLRGVKIVVETLDADLLHNPGDSLDKSALRAIKNALSRGTPRFPAVVKEDNPPIVVSFPEKTSILIGRANTCLLRLNAPDVSNEHARIGYEKGMFWIEDLGSTNGTFIGKQQISGRVTIESGTRIRLGRQTTIVCLTKEEEMKGILKGDDRKTAKRPQYPCLVSLSELVRPTRVVLSKNKNILIGREPGCDVWVGAPHISRKHCSVRMLPDGRVEIIDFSRNGVASRSGMLPKGEPYYVYEDAQVFDLGSNITFSICFDNYQEQAFRSTKGSIKTFVSSVVEQDNIGKTPVELKRDSMNRQKAYAFQAQGSSGSLITDFIVALKSIYSINIVMGIMFTMALVSLFVLALVLAVYVLRG